MTEKPKHSWSIKTPADLLEKAQRDLERFRNSHDVGSNDQVDHAFNCAVTTWHVGDWIWQAYQNECRRRGWSNIGDFRKWFFDKQYGECLKYCSDLANGSKHMTLNKNRSNIETHTSQNGIPEWWWEQVAASSKTGSFCMSITEQRDVLFVVDADGKRMRVSQILELSIEIWEGVIAEFEAHAS